MRNLRKLTAVVIAIALVLTSMTAAFAASTNEFEAQATVLKDLGLLEGNNGDLMLGEDLSRVQGAVLVLKTVLGKTDADQKAADTAVLSTYADAEKVPAWATGWMALAVKEGVLKGSTANELLANGPLYGKDLASMFMNALGFAADNDYAKAVELLAAKSTGTFVDSFVSDLTDAKLTRDAATAIVFDSLTATAKDAKMTVIETLIGTNADLKAVAEKAGLIVVAATLDVEKVSATNLRELVVTFNRAPNADEAKKAANYKIGSDNPEAVTLSDDGKTVTLRTSSAKAMGNYGTVDLTIVKAVGFDADKVVKGIAIKDTTVPSAVSVKTTGPKNIKVTVSEPLNESVTASQIAASLKIDGGLIAIDNSGVTLGGLELSLRTYSDLSEGSHKVEFLTATNLKDNAGYPIQASTLTFDYVKDTSELTLSVVESNETSVTFKFNKAINAGTLVGNADVKFRHTYNTSSNEVTGAQVTNSGDDQKFTVTFPTNKPFPPSTVTVYIDGADKVKDNYGNALKTTSFTVSTTADLVKPTATAEFVDAKTVKVTFSEDVLGGASASNSAENPSSYVLKSGSDVINATATFDTDSKKVVKLVTAADALNGTTYTLTIKNVKDTSIAGNQIDEVTLTFTGTDKVAPKVDSISLVSTTKVKVKFSEAMDVATITNKSIYKYDSAALGSDDTVEAVDSNKAAIITFKTAPTAVSHTLLVGWVKDVAGNWSVDYQTPFTFTGNNVAKIGLAEYQVTGKNAIKLKFEDTLKDMVVGDFSYTTDAGVTDIAPDSISVSIVDGVTYITLVTKDLPNTTGANVTVKSVGTTSAKNSFDTTLNFATTGGAIDKCAPAMVSTVVATKAANKSGTQVNTITITYSEAIYSASVQEADYTVTGYEIDGIAVTSSTTVVITVKSVDYGSYLAADGVKVKQVGEIQDSAKNILGAQDEWTAK